MDKNALIIIAKYPEKGKVKTRVRELSGEKRVQLYEQLLIGTMDKLGDIPGIDTFIAFAPENAEQYFSNYKVCLIPLHEGDLGIRMFEAFQKVFIKGYRKAVLVGADIPHLSASIILKSFEVLTEKDLVYGPAKDGGYYLVGMRRLIKDVFEDVPWSSDQTLKKSIWKAESSGYSVGFTEMLSDIDTFEDIKRTGYEI